MTEQEITQARADIAQLDIEQLRCGVMLQLLNIEALTKERDKYAKAADSMAMAHKIERDALGQRLDQWRAYYYELQAAAKLALEAMEQIHPDDLDCLSEIAALRQAGVQ